MRPIDADLLMKESVQEYERARQYYNAIKRMVEKAPILDIVEAKHGRWSLVRTAKINSCPEHWLECSECGKHRIIKMGEAMPNFCENCGADMRGERKGQ